MGRKNYPVIKMRSKEEHGVLRKIKSLQTTSKHMEKENGATLLRKLVGLNRSGKSCRLRWLNYLRPDVKRGNISPEEEDLIIRMHKLLGNRWALIARRLPGRTDNEIKNFWNINLSKRVPEARPHRIKINAKNDGADEGGNCTAKDDQVQVIQSITLNCTKAVAMIPSHHHLHDGDQRVNIQDQRVVDDISSSSFLRDLDNFINDVLHESEINGDQNYVVDDQEGEY
ncbi:unnamed protein product [Prunus armeniaca]|uniref:Uncharacterized protein n=1 Tax=Prunus armeniaca TaxID=36596 RepID=A0A6J5X329_PRUAR|nr:unnamed protein product [Prunus armeniaca]